MAQRIMCFGILILILFACSNVESDWNNAKQLDTVEAYENFLSMHPKGYFADSAKYIIELRMWQETQKVNSISAYRKYINTYSNGLFNKQADSALQHFDDLEWNIAKKKGTLKAINHYLDTFSDGRHRVYANEQISELKFRNRLIASSPSINNLNSPVRCKIVDVNRVADSIVIAFNGPIDMGEFSLPNGARLEITCILSELSIKNTNHLKAGAKGNLYSVFSKTPMKGYIRKHKATNGFLQARPPWEGPFPLWVPVGIFLNTHDSK